MSMVMEDDGFDIPPKSAAIIFNEDGTIDTCIPKMYEDDIPPHVMYTVALMLMLGDNDKESQIWKLINEKVEEMIRESQNEVEMEE